MIGEQVKTARAIRVVLNAAGLKKRAVLETVE